MRMHIELDERLVAAVDEITGARGRSAFVRDAIARAVREHQRWERLERAAGAIEDTRHDWDADPAAWVRAQRRSDSRRAG